MNFEITSADISTWIIIAMFGIAAYISHLHSKIKTWQKIADERSIENKELKSQYWEECKEHKNTLKQLYQLKDTNEDSEKNFREFERQSLLEKKVYREVAEKEISQLNNENENLQKTVQRLKKENDDLIKEIPQRENEQIDSREQTVIDDQGNHIVLTEEFKEILEKLENTSCNMFITGKAGTGKSTLLKLFRKITKKRIVVLAPTGIAALNAMGQTIHSFFRFPLGVITNATISHHSRLSSLLEYVDMIIIDEVSMVRVDMMDGIEKSLRLHKQNDKLFGGVQMVFFGDLYQLPPVVTDRDQARYLTSTYGDFFFFNAAAVSKMNLIYRELTFIFRQKNDDNFKEILNRFRENKLSEKDFQIINDQAIQSGDNIDLGGTLSVMLCPTK